MKKWVAILLCFTFALLYLQVCAGRAEPITSGDYEYYVANDGTAGIIKYTGNEEKLSVPKKLDGHVVASIEESAFSDCTDILSITIPDTVVYVGHYAFSGCTGLKSVSIPASVVAIGQIPFDGCESLTGIKVAADNPAYEAIDGVLFDKSEKMLVTYPRSKKDSSYSIPVGTLMVAEGSFDRCGNLKSVEIPDSVMNIGLSAFQGCYRLEKVTLPDGLEDIGEGAFNGCRSLTGFMIPPSVTSIGYSAFSDCESLTGIDVAADNPVYESIDGVLYDKTAKLLHTYPAGKTDIQYDIQPGTLVIGDNAFSDCHILTEISIPDGVTSIGMHAFSDCESLTTIRIPEGVTSIGLLAFYWCTGLTEVIIPGSVTSIADAFASGCSADLLLTVERGSYAEQYAADQMIHYQYASN